VIWNPNAEPDHHQKLNTSRGSPLAHVCQVLPTSVSVFVSYPVYRMTDRQNDDITSAFSVEVTTVFKQCKPLPRLTIPYIYLLVLVIIKSYKIVGITTNDSCNALLSIGEWRHLVITRET